jgi:integrase
VFDQFETFLIKEKKDSKHVKRGTRTVAMHLARLRTLQKSIPDLNAEDISKRLVVLYNNGNKGRSLNLYLHTLRIYGRYLKTDVYNTIDFFPEEAIHKTTMSDAEIEAFLALPPPTVTRYHWKSKGLISYVYDAKGWKVSSLFWKIFAFSGMRPGEVSSLTVDQIDFGRQVFIARGKTGQRNVPIAPILLPQLQAHITSLKTDYVFPVKRGLKSHGMSKTQWSKDFRGRIARLGIKRKGLTAHSLRHSFITRMLDENINLYTVQNIIGHKQGSPITAQYYHYGTKRGQAAIKQDPLSRKNLSKTERIIQGRKALEDLGFTVFESQEIGGQIRYMVTDE